MPAVRTSAPVLDARAVNRATLERQLLLRRASMTVPQAVEHLVGLQAQAPFPPYTGLWTRLAGFEPEHLATLILDRSVVRIALMRGTVHLVTADDCRVLRPVLQPMLERTLHHGYGRQLRGLDLDDLARTARVLLEEKPRNPADLGRLLAERFPGRAPNALASAARALLPLVQLPPRAVWGSGGRTVLTTAEAWLDRPLSSDATPDAMVVRYLAGFGPATVADMQKWSGLTRLREVVERLGPRLRRFRDDDGRDLYDLPDAPRPDPDTPAPVRFLPEYDNLLLAYADGERVVASAHRAGLMSVNGIIRATVLVDGKVAGFWRVTGTERAAALEIEPLVPLSAAIRAEIESEGARLLSFTAADAERHDLRFTGHEAEA